MAIEAIFCVLSMSGKNGRRQEKKDANRKCRKEKANREKGTTETTGRKSEKHETPMEAELDDEREDHSLSTDSAYYPETDNLNDAQYDTQGEQGWAMEMARDQ